MALRQLALGCYEILTEVHVVTSLVRCCAISHAQTQSKSPMSGNSLVWNPRASYAFIILKLFLVEGRVILSNLHS